MVSLKKILAPQTILHKLMTFGIALLVILLAAFFTPGKEGLSASVGTLVIVFILYYTLVSRRILETLILGTFFSIALLKGRGFVQGFIDQLFATMANADFAWIVLMCCFLNVFSKLLGKAGSMHAIARLIRRMIKKPKDLNLASWLMQFPLFFDDYMTIAVGGNIMAPMYDEMEMPREDGAFIIHTLAEPMRVLFPITSWAAFLGGLYVSGGMNADGTGMTAFFKSIPFQFYPIIAVLGTLLFALGKLPKFGTIKSPDKSLYAQLETEEDESGKKHGTLPDFFLPLIGMMAASFFFNFDIVPAMMVVLPATAAYYLIRGIIGSEDIEVCLVEGFADFMNLILLFCLSYMLNAVLSDMGYVDYLTGLVSRFVSPNLLPFIVFTVFCLSEWIMSLNWSLLLIAFPMILPAAISVGANPYLTGAAMISAGCFGCNMCYICDYTMLTSSVFGLKADRHASTCV
ncbi:Na+/H+ antiporter NhaC family protein, partial [Treponema pedis]